MRRQSEAIREAINGHSGVPQQHNHLAQHISDVEVSAAAPLDTASDVPRDGSRAIRRRRERARAYDGGLINMHVPKEASAHLMREAISMQSTCNQHARAQRSQRAPACMFGGHQWQSVAVSGHRKTSEVGVLSGNQWQSVAVGGNQW